MRALRRLAALAVSAGIVLGCAVPAHAMTFFYGNTPIELRMDALQEMIEEIRANYKDETELDDIFAGIYKGLFSSLGDPWSAYITPGPDDGTDVVTNDVEETYEGIGIVFRQAESGLRIVSVVSGSPAHLAGIRSGDYILKVGTTDVTGMSAEETAALIRGTSGSTVSLTLDRDGDTLVFDIVRETIRTDTVHSTMRRDGIAYIQIESFAEGTEEDFAESYDRLAADGAKAVVLDLRGNSGGSVNAAVQVADHLIHREGIISQLERQGVLLETVHSTPDEYAELPVVCLVDKDTASASELLAAALKDRGAATICGETTFGKGVAQYVGSGGKGNVFKLSVYYFLSPEGHAIDGVGVAPDVTVYSPSADNKEELAALRAGMAPINEEKKYYAGDTGLNVYGVQQRLKAMGYGVNPSGTMDAGTVEALRQVQAEAGVCPYGALDFCTLGIIRDKFDAFCDPQTEDLAMAKALELLQRCIETGE